MKNLLFIGDNLSVMNSVEFAKNVPDKIKMIHIDSSYNTGYSFSCEVVCNCSVFNTLDYWKT